MRKRTITTGGFGKTYAAAGWRVAWVIASPELSNAVRTVHDFLTICAPTPLQEAATVALNLPDSYYAQQIQDYTARRDCMRTFWRRLAFAPHLPRALTTSWPISPPSSQTWMTWPSPAG